MTNRCFSLFFVSISICLILGRPSSSQDKLERTSTLGPVSVTVSLYPSKPLIGDTLELGILVRAENKVEVLMPEFGEALGRFQISDFHAKETLDEDGATLFRQTYSLHSPPSGEHAIPPILIEFVDRRPGELESPEGFDAYELFSARMDFEIQSVIVSDASAELNPAMGKIEKETSSSVSRGVWAFTFVASVLGVAALGLILMLVFYRSKVIRKSAYEIARKQLDQLINQPLPDAHGIDDFYVRLTSIIRTYLENRFSLRAPELTTEEFLSDVSDSASLTPAHKKLLNDFLKHADLVKFAGVKPSGDDIHETISKASQFLDETKENAPMLLLDRQQRQADRGNIEEASHV